MADVLHSLLHVYHVLGVLLHNFNRNLSIFHKNDQYGCYSFTLLHLFTPNTLATIIIENGSFTRLCPFYDDLTLTQIVRLTDMYCHIVAMIDVYEKVLWK